MARWEPPKAGLLDGCSGRAAMRCDGGPSASSQPGPDRLGRVAGRLLPPHSGRSTAGASTASTNGSPAPRWPVPGRRLGRRLLRAGVGGPARRPRQRIRGRGSAGQRRGVRPGRALRRRRLPRPAIRGPGTQATAALLDCVDHLRMRLREAVDARRGLLDDEGRSSTRRWTSTRSAGCVEAAERRAKCDALEAFGGPCTGCRTSTRTATGPTRRIRPVPIGDDNPPGLNLPGPSPMLDLRSGTSPVVPAGPATGCYVLRDKVPGVGECEERVTHAALNKDTGLIDPDTGRGHRSDEAARHGGGQLREGRGGRHRGEPRQWQDLRASDEPLRGGQAALMVCALTHDDPVDDCRDRGWVTVLVGILAGAVVLAVVVTLFRARRRRRA